MGKRYVERLSHSCGTKGGLQVFLEDDGRYSGFCFACNTYVPNPYDDVDEGHTPPKPQVKSQEQVQKELTNISKFPQEKLKNERIDEDVVKHFNVRLGFDQETASEVRTHFYPYYKDGVLKAYQVKVLDGKKFFSVGDFSNVEPFGWQQAVKAGGRRLYITEGQKDAMTLFQVLKKRSNQDRAPAVISLPNGVKSVDKMQPYMKQFERWAEVVLVFDNDDAGTEATKTFCKMYPEAKVATLPLKDSHDMLMANREDELFQAVMFNAKIPLSDKLKRSSDVWDLASKRPEQGMSWPYPSLTEMTRGIRRGEGYYFGAGVKMGKSVLVNEIGAHLIVEHNLPVFLCKPEEENHITAQKLAGVATNTVFHDPKREWDQDAFERGKRLIDDKAIMYGEYGSVSWDALKREIRYVCMAEGVKDIIIDPITCLTVGLSSGEANDALIEISSEVASMCKELSFTYYIFCHLNAPQSGAPHERGGPVMSHQFAGSRSMMRFTHYMVGLEGNKDPDQPNLKNVRHLSLLEDRNFGETGKIPLIYNNNTGRLLEGHQSNGDDRDEN